MEEEALIASVAHVNNAPMLRANQKLGLESIEHVCKHPEGQRMLRPERPS